MMEILERAKIKNKSDLIFAKYTLEKLLQNYKAKDKDFLSFALMEIGTNIIKYAKDGEIWFVNEYGFLAIVGLDRGEGIKNVSWALKKNSSSKKGSLGVGLYALNSDIEYEFCIFSLTKTDFKQSGTIVGIFNKTKKDYVYLNVALIDKYSGDFFINNENIFFFADILGHGIKAYKSVQKIKDFIENEKLLFYENEKIIKSLHNFINKNSLRGLVCAIVKITDEIEIGGIGNITYFYNNNIFTLNKGIIGEIFDRIFTKKLKKDEIVLFSDGIDRNVVKMLSGRVKCFKLKPFVFSWFSDIVDDKSILIVKG